jgi:hypothetical protein
MMSHWDIKWDSAQAYQSLQLCRSFEARTHSEHPTSIGSHMRRGRSPGPSRYSSRCTHGPPTACSYKSCDDPLSFACYAEWFGKVSMPRINVLSIQRISAEDRAKIEAVDPLIELTDAGGWYDGEIRETWPAFTSARYLAPGATGSGTREERDRLLAEAEVILGGWPFPLDLRARAPRLKWFH